MEINLLKNTVLAVPLAIAFTWASLLIVHTDTETRQIGGPGTLCSICGTYNVRVQDKGWPVPATESVQSADPSVSYPDARSGPWPPGIIVDFAVWLLAAEPIILLVRFMEDRYTKT